jgi:regulator of protease activity HflC (stomatin/prohibitin superfamily)
MSNLHHQWGISCLRYEIRDITPPPRVMDAMELQVVAERKKRETVIQVCTST